MVGGWGGGVGGGVGAQDVKPPTVSTHPATLSPGVSDCGTTVCD